MTSAIRHFTVDCRDPYTLALFWSQVIDTPMDPDDHPGDPCAIVRLGPGQPDLLFEQVPEPKSVKNRAHLDLQPAVPREQEVQRLVDLGAAQVADHRRPDGSGWVVLADPEGNEFCVERSQAEREARD
ncbi:MAG: VOC family protein [Acidimicrobiales bacterium]